MNKFLFFSITFIIIFGVIVLFRGDVRDLALELEKKGLPQETRIIPAVTTQTSSPVPVVKLESINLAVPFSPQAPLGDWALPFQEACEETNAILVDRFYKNQTITQEEARQEILSLVDWEKRKLGYYMHTTAAETATIMRQYFGYKRVDVLENVTVEDIKTHLFAGRPVIVPVAGRLLGNPYYTQPGPVYHVFVIKGVTKDGEFITNDVGTRRGQNYVYDDEVLYNAIHDAPTGGDGWTTTSIEEYVLTGKKTIVVVYPNIN